MKDKKYFIPLIIVIIVLEISSVIFVWNITSDKETVLDNVKLKDNEKTLKGLAIMVETEHNSNDYEESNTSSWPKTGYRFNKEKSGCIDSTGSMIENSLSYDWVTNIVTVDTGVTTKCYIYFDYLYDGTGEENEPYLIQSIEDLVELSESVNSGNSYLGSYFSLTRTLDFQDPTSYIDSSTKKYGDINDNGITEELLTELTTGSGFTPIGYGKYNSVTRYFSGVFNGNDYAINNIFIDNDIYSGCALFGYVIDGSISNLTTSGNINTSINSETGGIIGAASNINLINLTNKTNVKSEIASYTTGGIIASVYSGNNLIENCINEGTIQDGNNTGGIIGYNGAKLIINNSFNKGTIVKTKGQNVGGIVGRDNLSSNYTEINDSYNIGIITGEEAMLSNFVYIGGIMGHSFGKVTINSSYNMGNIFGSKNPSTEYYDCPGGIIGAVANNTIKINNSYNTGNIYNGGRTGGILAFSWQSIVIVNESYNVGKVISDLSYGDYATATGGIIGYNYKGTNYVINSYNNGDITSYLETGGLIGFTSFGGNSKIINAYNVGNINSSTSYLAGGATVTWLNDNLINNIYLNNIYNLGTVSGKTGSYGIAYIYPNDTYSFINAYHLNTINGSNVEGITTPMSESDMKSETFVNTLNNNLANINLSEIDESLAEYTLSTWKLGSEGYPVFSYQE